MSVRDMFFPADRKFTKEEEMEFAKEELAYNVIADILVVMEDLNITIPQLAEMVGKNRLYVTRILNGTQNMSIKMLSDICFVLKIKPEIKLTRIEDNEQRN